MAQQKQVQGRFTQKIDTTENWNKAVNFIPMPGEIIIYKDGDIVKEKIGDGVTTVGNLKFNTDNTLTIEGATADSKAVGDALTDIYNQIIEEVKKNSSCQVAENGGLIKNENNELAINDEMIFFFMGCTAVDIANVPAVERLEGDGQEFYTTAPSTLFFRSTAPLNELQDIQIDGETVDSSNYELEEGSTIVKLKHDYLSTLNVGNYELTVVSNSKTSKGNFTVASPELNEYGFYYNQFYYINWLDLGGNFAGKVAFKISPDHRAWLLNFDASSLSEISASINNNVWTISNSDFKLIGTFSNNGKSFITSEVFAAGGGWNPDYSGTDVIELKIETDKIAADDTYIYFTDPVSNNEFVALAADKTQTTYSAPKTNIKGTPIISFAHACFFDNVNLISVDFIPKTFTKINTFSFKDCSSLTNITIPEAIINIGQEAFYSCGSLTSVIIPDSVVSIDKRAFRSCTSMTNIFIGNGVTSIGEFAFAGCSKLTNIIYAGTISQWNAVNKGADWNSHTPATHVHCVDGDVEI